jgi:hypothetical protein
MISYAQLFKKTIGIQFGTKTPRMKAARSVLANRKPLHIVRLMDVFIMAARIRFLVLKYPRRLLNRHRTANGVMVKKTMSSRSHCETEKWTQPITDK